MMHLYWTKYLLPSEQLYFTNTNHDVLMWPILFSLNISAFSECCVCNVSIHGVRKVLHRGFLMESLFCLQVQLLVSHFEEESHCSFTCEVGQVCLRDFAVNLLEKLWNSFVHVCQTALHCWSVHQYWFYWKMDHLRVLIYIDVPPPKYICFTWSQVYGSIKIS